MTGPIFFDEKKEKTENGLMLLTKEHLPLGYGELDYKEILNHIESKISVVLELDLCTQVRKEELPRFNSR